MYDCYMNGHYQFCSSPDLYNFTFRKNTATQGSFTPRHGTVIPITEAEYQLLLKLPDVTGINQPSALTPPLPETYHKVLSRSQIVITDGKTVDGKTYDLGGRHTVKR